MSGARAPGPVGTGDWLADLDATALLADAEQFDERIAAGGSSAAAPTSPTSATSRRSPPT